jgi:hypothetical protein
MELAADADHRDTSAFSKVMELTFSPQVITREQLKELIINCFTKMFRHVSIMFNIGKL